MTNEKKVREILNCERCKKVIALSGATCSSPCSNFKELLELAVWKDEQFAKIGYTKKQLRSMGFGFTLNGDIVTPKEVEEMTKEYIEYQKRQMIEKATEFLKLHMPFGEVSESLKDEVIEDLRKAMEE